MSWLATLDTRARVWSGPQRWLYLGFKWGLVALGAYLFGGLLLQRLGLITL